MNSTLLTVSGNIPADIHTQVAQGKRPEADYLALARFLPADLLDYAAARKMLGGTAALLEKIGGPDLMLAWACFQLRRRYKVIFTDGEQIGIPLASLLKTLPIGQRPRHLMIAHILSVPKKMMFFDHLKIHSHIDTIFAYSTWQKNFIQERWSLPIEKVVFTPFMVDASFFSPDQANDVPPLSILKDQNKPVLCAIGLEFRDYSTLIQAVQGLDVLLVIAAASPWSKRSDTTQGQAIPKNVIVSRFSQYELRSLYSASQFLVMPLFEVNFQAGVTAILEAMAMEKAVICSRTPGQTDVIVEGKTGLYVPPENSQSLRSAILYLLKNPEKAQEYGKNGRQRILEEMSLECYIQRLKQYTYLDHN
jgi:glycosyltransferase involved in cell wall biosynthesis